MAERIADNAEQLVDEMKRKARRRLVGAIVLALGAAIVLPMLLEKEPRPLGDDVSVQIPPVDEGKFVNRLTGKSGESKALPKSESKASAPPAKAETTAPAMAAMSAGDAPTPKADTPAPKADSSAPKAEVPTPKSEPKAASKAESATAAAPASASIPSSASALPATATASAGASSSSSAPAQGAAAAPPAKVDGYVVQLGSFIDDKGANALSNKLKKGGYAAYVVPYETSRGTMWRVRVGGYPTRPEAEAARTALKGEGQNGIIVTAQ